MLVFEQIKNKGQKVLEKCRSLIRNDRAAVAVILALAIIPVLISIGAAIDVSRAYVVKSRLANALDAAGLAVGSSTGTDAELQQVLENFYYANFPVEELGDPGAPSMTITNDVIKISGSAVVPTTFMKIVGINSLTVSINDTEITREIKGLEVALVLDNTGSMSRNGKIGQLRTASHELVNILFGTETMPALLKVSLVPFVTTVNVGQNNAGFVQGLGAHDYSPDTWKGCVKARAYPHDTLDSDQATGGLWDPYYWPKESYTLLDYPSYGSYCPNNWTNSVDTVPPYTKGPNQACPQPITPLTNNRAELEAAIDTMEPWSGNGTMVNIGAAWGWRVLSPGAPFSEGSAYGDVNWKKVMIILTDGQNVLSSPYRNCQNYRITLDGVATGDGSNPEGNGVNSHYTGYGYAYENRLGSKYRSTAQANLNTRLEEVCQNIKNSDITVYTITFQLNATDIKSIFETCATDPSKYFDSPSNESLSATFKAIGAELSNLRISK